MIRSVVSVNVGSLTHAKVETATQVDPKIVDLSAGRIVNALLRTGQLDEEGRQYAKKFSKSEVH